MSLITDKLRKSSYGRTFQSYNHKNVCPVRSLFSFFSFLLSCRPQNEIQPIPIAKSGLVCVRQANSYQPLATHFALAYRVPIYTAKLSSQKIRRFLRCRPASDSIKVACVILLHTKCLRLRDRLRGDTFYCWLKGTWEQWRTNLTLAMFTYKAISLCNVNRCQTK